MHPDYNPSYNDTRNQQDFSNYGETIKSPFHAAKFPSAVNTKNDDDDYDFFRSNSGKKPPGLNCKLII